MAKRKAITATGTALLALVAAAANGVLMLTQAEGAEQVAAGNLELTGNTDGDLAEVRLTDAGRAALAAAGGDNGGAASTPSYELESGIPLPEKRSRRSNGNRESQYPFAKMEVGQSFHIPKTEDNKNPADRIAPTITRLRAQAAKPVFEADGTTPVMETVKQITYQLDDKGKRVKNAEGGFIKTGEVMVQRQKTAPAVDYLVQTVGAEDPKGEGARIWRVK